MTLDDLVERERRLMEAAGKLARVIHTGEDLPSTAQVWVVYLRLSELAVTEVNRARPSNHHGV